MEDVHPGCLPQAWNQDLTDIFLMWQLPGTEWTHLVKKVWKMHVAQNAIMVDAKRLHGAVFRNLRSAGATFVEPTTTWEDELGRFTCFCGKVFESSRALLAHQRKAHSLFSLEHQFLQGCTCLHCGKFLWTTHRLQQHLACIGFNPCNHALHSQQRQVPYAREDHRTAAAFAGLTRREALQTAGPAVQQIQAVDRRREEISVELAACHGRLVITTVPPKQAQEGEALGEQLTECTLR